MKKYYSLLLLAIAIVGCNTNDPYEPYVPENAQPTANFTYTASGLIVKFTNQSKNARTCLWDFGDGKTSSENNPTHTYSEPGTYTVSMVVTNGDKQSTKTIRITVKNPTEVRVVGFRIDKLGLDSKYWYFQLDDSGPYSIKTWVKTVPIKIESRELPYTFKLKEPVYLTNISKHKYYTIYAFWSDTSNKGFAQRLKQDIYRDKEMYNGYPNEITKKNSLNDTQITILLEWR